MCPYLLSMQSGSHGKPLAKLLKAIAKEAQMLSARLLTYVMGTQKNRLDETVLLSAQNTCLNWWLRK